MNEESRDILIELRADMRHVREKVDHLSVKQEKQWEKIDSQGEQITGHDKTIIFLVWGFRLLISGAVSGSLGWMYLHK